MYRPKVFAEDRLEVLHKFIKAYPLATIITSDTNGITANLIPVSLHNIGDKGTIRLHLAKANGQVESLREGKEILILFQGPNAYVTPNWYPKKKVDGKAVPTWNYSMVQVRGKPIVIDDPEWVLQQITDLTEANEGSTPQAWNVSDAPKEYIQSQLKVIIGVEIAIEHIEGKFKVSQNQPEENRKNVEEKFFEAGDQAMAQLVAKRGFDEK